MSFVETESGITFETVETEYGNVSHRIKFPVVQGSQSEISEIVVPGTTPDTDDRELVIRLDSERAVLTIAHKDKPMLTCYGTPTGPVVELGAETKFLVTYTVAPTSQNGVSVECNAQRGEFILPSNVYSFMVVNSFVNEASVVVIQNRTATEVLRRVITQQGYFVVEGSTAENHTVLYKFAVL